MVNVMLTWHRRWLECTVRQPEAMCLN